tara:strand:+ start:2432 stop:2845 length:414 start_codon:yes stop_codon:yes gene_type:complete
MIGLSIYIIILIATIILHYAIYTWTNDLKKLGCKCSSGTVRDVINMLALIFLLLIPYRIVNYNDKYFSAFFYGFIRLITITYFILVIYYINKLNTEACECSNNWKKDYSFITVIIFSSLILFLIVLKLILFSKLDNK